MNGTLLPHGCRLGGGGGYSNPTCCNQVCLNILHSEAGATKNIWT